MNGCLLKAAEPLVYNCLRHSTKNNSLNLHNYIETYKAQQGDDALRHVLRPFSSHKYEIKEDEKQRDGVHAVMFPQVNHRLYRRWEYQGLVLIKQSPEQNVSKLKHTQYINLVRGYTEFFSKDNSETK